MMNEAERFEQIEAYIKGNMSMQERQAFENALAADDALQAELAAHRKADTAITYMNQKELKQKLIAIDSQLDSKKDNSRVRKLLIRVAIAASIVLFAGVSLVYTTDYFDQESSLAELSEEYFVPAQHEVFKGKNTEDKLTFTEQLENADKLYLKGDYNGAIVEYKRLSLLDHTQNALAEWNLAMSYLLSETHQSEFDLLLNQIATDNTHLYNERALKLQSELK